MSMNDSKIAWSEAEGYFLLKAMSSNLDRIESNWYNLQANLNLEVI